MTMHAEKIKRRDTLSQMQAMPNAPPPVLSVHDVTLQMGVRTIVTHFDQDFAPGQRWCVMGPNGAGKTTFIQMLAGLRAPQKGHVCLEGRTLVDWPLIELARRRAWMPQVWQDAFSLSVMECLLFAQHPYRETFHFWQKRRSEQEEALQTKAHTILKTLEIEALATRSVSSLSGGERQRVALATALCQDTPFLLLDEPLAHVDIPHQLSCLRVLREHCVATETRDAGCVIFSSHDFYIACRFATHVLILDGLGGAASGLIEAVLTPECVSRAFQHPFRWVDVEPGAPGFLMPIL